MSSKQNKLLEDKQQIVQKWKFSDIIAIPEIKTRWEKVRKYFFLRESTYDMTNRCNIKCEGCYYYNGEKSITQENNDPNQWRQLMQSEKKRGITYVVLAGAEPSLVPDLCDVCFQEIPYGCIATNGLKKIPESIDYQIHLSVWGNDETSLKTRKAKNMLRRQMDNYQHDPRTVFVYTITSKNIDEIHEVADFISKNDSKLTFNMFSAPVGYTGELRHNDISLIKTRKTMQRICSEYPDHIYFSSYNIVSHTHRLGLHDLFHCSYPRMNPSKDVGLGRSFRQYRTDLTWDRGMSCCVPDTDCADCRHYAAGSAIVTSRMYRHAIHPNLFSAWLDYVDVYLSVWVRGYKKDKNLCTGLIAPPGHEIFEH
jgi:MoaA/NifB/PqqE/SkfB family radical SAM enzyme